MYSVISDGEDGKSRTPSPSEINDPFNPGILENDGRYHCLLNADIPKHVHVTRMGLLPSVWEISTLCA